jgi:hypothetical protein
VFRATHRNLDGLEALEYAREHLTMVWSQGAGRESGYVCPDSGQLWIMDFPQHGDHHGPVRIRVVGDQEWEAEKPADLGRPRDDVHKDQRWRVVRDLATSGVTSWRAPFTGGFECVIPSGTVVTVDNDPPMGASAVYCVPENYDDLERAFVPAEDREAEKYGGYAVLIDLADFGEALEPL